MSTTRSQDEDRLAYPSATRTVSLGLAIVCWVSMPMIVSGVLGRPLPQSDGIRAAALLVSSLVAGAAAWMRPRTGLRLASAGTGLSIFVVATVSLLLGDSLASLGSLVAAGLCFGMTAQPARPVLGALALALLLATASWHQAAAAMQWSDAWFLLVAAGLTLMSRRLQELQRSVAVAPAGAQ